MNAPLAWLDGRFVPFHEAALPLHDAGFVSGATVVDNARTYSRKLFRWADHLARFRHDCDACFVPLEATDAELTEAADTLVKANAAGGEVHVVTFATPGPLGVYTGEGNGPPTLGMVTYPVSELRYRPFFSEGAVLVPVPMAVLLPTVKHRSRMNWHVADHIAKRDSRVPHALAVNLIDGAIHETSIANVLAVIGGAVVSPPRDSVLHGISLKVTRELCGELGIGFHEEPIRADGPFMELMLCGTGFGLAGVKRLGDRIFDSPGPVTRRLLAAWSALTGGG
jgi:branched-subunit amino acid aminotransferase/4-amino-4-deoxychorismate lyase